MKESAGVLVAVEGRPTGALNAVVHVYLGSRVLKATVNVRLVLVRPELLLVNDIYVSTRRATRLDRAT